MRGKRIAAVACAVLMLCSASAMAAEPQSAAADAAKTPEPTCVLIQFTDDTRFKQMDSAERLSELVMNQIVNGNKFDLKVSKPVSKDMEKLLYDDRRGEVEAAKKAIESGDLSAVFESPEFQEGKAITISSSQKGQCLPQTVTAKIGQEAGANYLLQGTIVNLGMGTFEDAKFDSMVSSTLAIAGGLLGLNSGWGSLLGNLSNTTKKVASGFSVMADMRVIYAPTGQVVWTDRVTEHAGKGRVDYAFGHVGSTDVSESDYVKALDKVAKHLVADMEKALGDKNLFTL